MTRQERRLWYDYLRDYPVRFRRQEVIGPFIADFFCDKAHLVIELDGSQHFEGEGLDYDSQRTAYLNKLGLCVLRISNHDVDTNFPNVCLYIHSTVEKHLHGKPASP